MSISFLIFFAKNIYNLKYAMYNGYESRQDYRKEKNRKGNKDGCKC